MLKKFFMSTLSSFVGAWLAIVLFCVVATLVTIGIVAKMGVSGKSGEDVSKGSVLQISLSGAIEERETPVDLDYISLLQGDVQRPQTLASLVEAIREAKENKNISAIYLRCGGISAAPATLNALRSALVDFRESGKKILAYGDNIAMGDYYIASVADRMMLNPAGTVMLHGLGGTSLYYKDLFDKLGIEFQVVKVGTFKSAVEPFIMNDMSAPARAQLDTLYGTLWKVMREGICEQRSRLTPESIDSLVNEFAFLKPTDYLVEAGVVDTLIYGRSLDSIVAAAVGKEKKKLNYVSPKTLLSQSSSASSNSSKKQIAVLYACGDIEDGGGKSAIDFEIMVPQIVKLAEDENVKGMVLRVNSPGGAVFGSDQIGEALDYFQSKGKTLAVSMGDYAASGGYWISCCADRIFANPMTITGSIGIFGLIPNAAGLIDKIGIHPQNVSTNPDTNFPTLYSPMTAPQQEALQKEIERGYDRFVDRVARGRKMPEERVRQIGEGRVWDAYNAKRIGLVDEIGSLREAVEWTAGECGLGDSYAVSYYPAIETGIWDFIPELQGMKAVVEMKKAMEGNYDELFLRFAASVLRQKPVQVRMPYFTVGFGVDRAL